MTGTIWEASTSTLLVGRAQSLVDYQLCQSVINYLDRKQLIPFWVNTSSNKMIKAAMRECDKTFKEGYEDLIERGTVTALVNYEASFYEIKNTSSLLGLFAPQAGSA